MLLNARLLPFVSAFAATIEPNLGHGMPRDSCGGIAKKPSESTSLNKAKAALEQGLDLLASYQKLIKIADRSESTRMVA